MAWASVAIRGAKVRGKVAIPSSRSIRKKIFAVAADGVTWEEIWGTAPCAFASLIWSQRKFLRTRKMAIPVARISSDAHIAHLQQRQPLAFTWKDPARSI